MAETQEPTLDFAQAAEEIQGEFEAGHLRNLEELATEVVAHGGGVLFDPEARRYTVAPADRIQARINRDGLELMRGPSPSARFEAAIRSGLEKPPTAVVVDGADVYADVPPVSGSEAAVMGALELVAEPLRLNGEVYGHRVRFAKPDEG